MIFIFLGLEKFCQDLKFLHEHIFAKIGLKIFRASYLMNKLVTMLY
jgi:hypothetical protein